MLYLGTGVYTLVMADLQYRRAMRLMPARRAKRSRNDRSAIYSLRSRSRLIEWSASLRNTSVARGLVGRMFSIRFGRLIECQMSRAANTACSSVSVE